MSHLDFEFILITHNFWNFGEDWITETDAMGVFLKGTDAFSAIFEFGIRVKSA